MTVYEPTNNTNIRTTAKIFKPNAVLYPELSYSITGICFTVHKELGPYAREKQYGDAIETILKESGIPYEREVRIGESGNILDFLVEGKLALELKAKRALLSMDYRQIQNYLQHSGVRLGILINFRETYIKPQRIVRIDSPRL